MTTNERLTCAVGSYRDYMEATGIKPNTIDNHMQLLRRAIRVWGDIYVSSITHKHIDELFICPQWGPSTRNLYLSNFRAGFMPYCKRQGWMKRDYDPTEGWKMAKVTQREKKWIPLSDFPDLLDAAKTPLDRIIVAIGLFTMCRGSEITYLKVGDVDFDQNTLLIYRQKTEEEDRMPMPLELRDELLLWFRHYEAAAGPLQPEWYVTPSRGPLPMARPKGSGFGPLQPTGEPPRYKPLNRLFKPYEAVKRTIKEMGMDDYRAGVHLLRRSSARAYYDILVASGHDHALLRVGAILGHKDTKTTQIYLGIKVEREQRNASLAGKSMFPNMRRGGTVTELRRASNG